MLREFQKMLKGRPASALSSQTLRSSPWWGGDSTLVPTEATEHRSLGLLDPVLPEGTGRRLVAEAFHCRLRGPVLVDKKTLAELQGFQAVRGRGGRGRRGAQGPRLSPRAFAAGAHALTRPAQGQQVGGANSGWAHSSQGIARWHT